jgi:CelD/BcsL family acetyltransferase involved in cellulose biosynthesis
VRAIYDLKAAQETPGAPNLFSDPQRREFMVAICGVAPCDIFTLESPSSLVAAALTFRDANTRRFYTICYDNRWAHYSPGIALLFEATRISLAEGLDCDYMTGEQPHKLRFATASVPLYRVQATAAELSSIRYRERLAAA